MDHQWDRSLFKAYKSSFPYSFILYSLNAEEWDTLFCGVIFPFWVESTPTFWEESTPKLWFESWITLLRVDSTFVFHSITKWSIVSLQKEWISTPVHLESMTWFLYFPPQSCQNMHFQFRNYLFVCIFSSWVFSFFIHINGWFGENVLNCRFFALTCFLRTFHHNYVLHVFDSSKLYCSIS